MKPHRFISFLIIILMSGVADAQIGDAGFELSAEYSHSIRRGLSLSVEEALRFNQFGTQYSKSESGIGLDYSLCRRFFDLHDMRLKLGVDYSFINRLNNDHYYENQQCVNIKLSLTKRVGMWRMAYRCKMETTFRDENSGSYSYNPKIYLRNRLKVSYECPTKPWRLYASAESFYRVNNPKGRFVDELRCRTGATLRLDRHNSLDFFVKYSHEIQVKNPERNTCLGISYSFD